MVDVNLTPVEVGTILGVGVTTGTMLFHAIMRLGSMANDIKRHDDRLDIHDEEIDKIKSGLGV